MSLYNQALETYKAIHGEEPEHAPYKGASDAPFNGMSVEMVSELCDERKVKNQLKEWKSQYPLNSSPLDSTQRFVKMVKSSKSKKNLWNNAIWIPSCGFNIDTMRENPFSIFEHEHMPDSDYIAIMTICDSDGPSLDLLNSRISYKKELVGVDRARNRIPNPAENDLWNILTTSPYWNSTRAINPPKWKMDEGKKKMSLKDLPEVEYYREYIPCKKYGLGEELKIPVFPQAILNTSHGYPLILVTEVMHMRLKGDDEVITYRDVELDMLSTKNINVRFTTKILFAGEVVRKGDPSNTLTARYKRLQGEVG